MLARCPNCRATFSTERTGQQACPVCKKQLFVPDVAQAIPSPGGAASPNDPGQPQFAEPQNERAPELDGTPWERRPEQPISAVFAAWKDTMVLALFEPSKLFSRARLDRRNDQITFAVLTFSVFSIIGNLLERLLIGPQQEQMVARLKELMGDRIPPALTKLLENDSKHSLVTTLVTLLLAPVVGLIFLYLNAAVTHLFAMLLNQNRKGFSATFAACAYAMAPAVLYAIPGCGSPVALVWLVVLTGIGLKVTHGMSTGAATAATIAPYVVICCLSCALIALLGTAGLNALSTGGFN